MNHGEKILNSILWWIKTALTETERSLQSGEADDYALMTFKNAAKAIKTLRRNYKRWKLWEETQGSNEQNPDR